MPNLGEATATVQFDIETETPKSSEELRRIVVDNLANFSIKQINIKRRIDRKKCSSPILVNICQDIK